MEPEPVQINGTQYEVSCILTNNRNASARLRDRTIVIRIPSRWPQHEKQKTLESLRKRAIKAIEKGKWRHKDRKKLRFFHGQELVAFGKKFQILFHPSGKISTNENNGITELLVPMDLNLDDKTSAIVRAKLSNLIMPDLHERIDHFNRAHFNARIPNISIKDTITLWGSLSSDNSLNINFRLLFMPSEILDYVIVHELAHTKYKSHGKRFWDVVEAILPDNKERRKWLRENGWSFP